MHYGIEILRDAEKLRCFHRRLVLFAASRLSDRSRTIGAQLNAEAEDLAQEAILLIYSNSVGLESARVWDGETCILRWCCSQINSMISNRMRTYVRQQERKESVAYNDTVLTKGADNMVSIDPSAAAENSLDQKALRNRFEALIREDELAMRVFLQLYDNDGITNKQVAEALNMDVSDVRNARKRIKRNLGSEASTVVERLASGAKR